MPHIHLSDWAGTFFHTAHDTHLIIEKMKVNGFYVAIIETFVPKDFVATDFYYDDDEKRGVYSVHKEMIRAVEPIVKDGWTFQTLHTGCDVTGDTKHIHTMGFFNLGDATRVKLLLDGAYLPQYGDKLLYHP